MSLNLLWKKNVQEKLKNFNQILPLLLNGFVTVIFMDDVKLIIIVHKKFKHCSSLTSPIHRIRYIEWWFLLFLRDVYLPLISNSKNQYFYVILPLKDTGSNCSTNHVLQDTVLLYHTTHSTTSLLRCKNC